jgi:pre-rRNA-processing protein TSR1
VHKFDRYLYPGQAAIASFIGPLTWGNVPLLYFQRTTPADADADTMESTTPSTSLQLVGTGTSLPPSMGRIIAKRVILTGHPYKINKRVVTVRYMFFNDGDVKWFKSLPLWTRRGRSGFIKESLGTHGYFKATFDGKINPMDAVAVSLYKRVWPRSARVWKPEIEA